MGTITKFEVGKIYSGCVIFSGRVTKPCTVIKRTPSTVTFTDGRFIMRGKVFVLRGIEQVRNNKISISGEDLVG